MSKQQSKGDFGAVFAAVAIPLAIVVGYVLYYVVLGAASNFEEGNRETGDHLNILGLMFKGGPIVGLLIAVNIIVLTFGIERFISLSNAKGKGSIDRFVRNIRGLLNNGQIDSAIAECDRQRGSVAAVLRSGLTKYKAIDGDTSLDKEGKITALKQELEEATSLELPMLSKNLIILSTCASLGVLIGLLGTVSGMIRSFDAMSQSGAQDATALSAGISEALWNTFLGIAASAIAIILFNFFSNKIDSMTYGIDEAGYSVVQTFATKHTS
ncbi:MAG: MotA/TolQ/ExbB proton channel family protein [Flavobacteriales bacterium]|nr:MotA/TolQ/ExbB proton channel family protein [Flavobacteriales bacterium]